MPQIRYVDLSGQYWPQDKGYFWNSDVAEVRIVARVVPAQRQSDRKMDRAVRVADVCVRDELQTWLGLSLWAH